MSISLQLQGILAELPHNVRLVAVSKFHPAADILEAYDVGQRIFGESKVQELCAKYEVLPKDIAWHFIGHLQSNKAKYIVPFVSLIHGVDSLKLLLEIDRQAKKCDRKIAVLLQLHIAQEETKFGFSFGECLDLVASDEFLACRNIEICGLMGMASNTDDELLAIEEFRGLAAFFNDLQASHFSQQESFKELSIGMSEDYLLAIAQGSTMVRIGSKIFGQRN